MRERTRSERRGSQGYEVGLPKGHFDAVVSASRPIVRMQTRKQRKVQLSALSCLRSYMESTSRCRTGRDMLGYFCLAFHGPVAPTRAENITGARCPRTPRSPRRPKNPSLTKNLSGRRYGWVKETIARGLRGWRSWVGR